jgi:hypothetical protein
MPDFALRAYPGYAVLAARRDAAAVAWHRAHAQLPRFEPIDATFFGDGAGASACVRSDHA